LKGHAHATFQVVSGGYAQKYDPKGGWPQVTRAKAMKTSARTCDAPTRRMTRVGALNTSHFSIIAVAGDGLRPVCIAVSCGLFTLATAASTAGRTQFCQTLGPWMDVAS